MNSFKLDSKRSLIIMSREGNFRSSQLDSEFLEFLEHHHQAHNGWLMRSNFFPFECRKVNLEDQATTKEPRHRSDE